MTVELGVVTPTEIANRLLLSIVGKEGGSPAINYYLLRSLIAEALAEQAPPPISRVWQQIKTAPKNTKVLAAYQNENGKWRIVTACYHTQLEWSEEYGDHEEEFAPEAWYEENDSSEVIYPTSRVPTHWMPLPAYPATEETSDV